MSRVIGQQQAPSFRLRKPSPPLQSMWNGLQPAMHCAQCHTVGHCLLACPAPLQVPSHPLTWHHYLLRRTGGLAAYWAGALAYALSLGDDISNGSSVQHLAWDPLRATVCAVEDRAAFEWAFPSSVGTQGWQLVTERLHWLPFLLQSVRERIAHDLASYNPDSDMLRCATLLTMPNCTSPLHLEESTQVNLHKGLYIRCRLCRWFGRHLFVCTGVQCGVYWVCFSTPKYTKNKV